MERVPMVGEQVVWHEPTGRAFNALITAVWSNVCINLVIVSGDTDKTDSYGRQIERYTSQPKGSQPGMAFGMYWRFPDETPNPIQAPQQT